MSKRTRKSSKPAKPKSYILLGTEEYAKPRGARFSGDADPELLATAAEDMHLWLIAVTNPPYSRGLDFELTGVAQGFELALGTGVKPPSASRRAATPA